ncbi:MAG: MetQ/NlpA family ABC transporter substrate-binding protein [Peptococcaceae bacterium]|nr:MetQ/NlpA family ABC transporter substrate-binding protein [Peptococcaceae bacterium]
MLRIKRHLIFFVVCLLALALTLSGCGTKPASSSDTSKPAEKKVVKIGATAVPHAEILEAIKPKLAEKGIDLQIVVFNDYIQPNLATDKGDIDANYFQHIPYLETFNTEHKLSLVTIAKVHIEPMGIYSKKVKATADFQKGGTVAIPNDPSNAGRALCVLQSAGLIKLKDGVGIKGTVQDIVENPKELNVKMIDAAQLPRVLDDPKVTGAVINTNYALEAGLNPTKDALYVESKDSPYSNILVTKKERAEDPVLKTVAQELNSDYVKKFIEDKYKGAVVPAF